jgi:hypothetical protein
VSPVKYQLSFYIPEDDILHSDRRENLKSHLTCSVLIYGLGPRAYGQSVRCGAQATSVVSLYQASSAPMSNHHVPTAWSLTSAVVFQTWTKQPKPTAPISATPPTHQLGQVSKDYQGYLTRSDVE